MARRRWIRFGLRRYGLLYDVFVQWLPADQWFYQLEQSRESRIRRERNDPWGHDENQLRFNSIERSDQRRWRMQSPTRYANRSVPRSRLLFISVGCQTLREFSFNEESTDSYIDTIDECSMMDSSLMSSQEDPAMSNEMFSHGCSELRDDPSQFYFQELQSAHVYATDHPYQYFFQWFILDISHHDGIDGHDDDAQSNVLRWSYSSSPSRYGKKEASKPKFFGFREAWWSLSLSVWYRPIHPITITMMPRNWNCSLGLTYGNTLIFYQSEPNLNLPLKSNRLLFVFRWNTSRFVPRDLSNSICVVLTSRDLLVTWWILTCLLDEQRRGISDESCR